MANSASDIQLRELRDVINQQNKTIQNLNQTIENLNAELAFLRGKLFGSKSERRKDPIPGQLSFFDEEKEAEIIEPEYIEIESHKRARKKKPTLDEQFENLPATKVYIDTLSDEEKICPVCDTQMVPIGHEYLRTEIKFTPAKLEKIEYYGTTYGCPECKETEEPIFVKDTGTSPLIPRSYASPSLVAWIMHQKFTNSLPFYRQEADWNRFGVTITRNAMAHWVIHAAEEYFLPVYEFFHRELLKRRFIMMDELC